MRTPQIIVLLLLIVLCLPQSSFPDDIRDKHHQPDKVMDIAGIKPGMIIGEIGAGHGYFTFHLAKRVGETGKVYANDISRSALRSLNAKADRVGVSNIETILGEVEDPLLPSGLDAVFIVNAFHDLAEPVALLNNLISSLRPHAKVVILDRDPSKFKDYRSHFLPKEKVLEFIEASDFELDRLETFLPQHNIYIVKLKIRDGSCDLRSGLCFLEDTGYPK